MTTPELAIVLSAVNRASEPIRRVQGVLDGLGSSDRDLRERMRGVDSNMLVQGF